MKTAEEWLELIKKDLVKRETSSLEFIEQIQSDAIESTVRTCAQTAEESEACCGTGEIIAKKILSLIPQKEKKV